jgi:hypothetical protein
MATHTLGEEGRPTTPLPSFPPHDDAEREPLRSGYGSIPGAELPGGMYLTMLLGYVWMLAAAWLAFGSSDESDLNLGVATVLTIVFVALPVLIVRTAAARSGKRTSSDTVGTATGDLPLSQACVQILLLPFVLALAATAFGLTYLFAG